MNKWRLLLGTRHENLEHLNDRDGLYGGDAVLRREGGGWEWGVGYINLFHSIRYIFL